MNRLFLALISATLLVAQAVAAPNVIQGEMTLTHGFVTQSDGTKKSVAGLKLPLTITRIDSSTIGKNTTPILIKKNQTDSLFSPYTNANLRNPFGGNGSSSNGNPQEANVVVYNSNFNSYGAIDGDSPSILDDLVLATNAVNKTWTELSFGIYYNFQNQEPFLVRWRIWDSAAELPAGQNDFINEIADFGGIINQNLAPGSYFLTVGISIAGMSAPDTSVYFAQQFRTTQTNGEGPFVPEVGNIFNNTTSPPSIGGSEDNFIYDIDPLDGIYENSEVEIFEGSRGDLALVIKVNDSSQSTTLFPTSVTPGIGSVSAGNMISLWFGNDGDVFEMNPSFAGSRTDPIATFIVEGSTPTSNPLSIKFDAVMSASLEDVNLKIEFWNYVTNAWVQIDSRTIGVTPTAYSVFYGGTAPLSQFVSPVPRKMRARVSYKNNSNAVPRTFKLRSDKYNWVITS